MSVADAVQSIADKLAAIEEIEFGDLDAEFKEISGGSDLGTLESLALASEFKANVSGFRAWVWSYHARLTLRAQELGIDIPARDGGR